MNSKWLKGILAGGALIAVTAVVGVYGVPVVQASSGPELVASIAGLKTFAHPGFGASDMQALLAEALGISVEELEAAQQTAFEAYIAAAFDEGRITQEQADQILEADGYPGRGFGHGRGRFKGELPEDFESGEGSDPERGRFRGRGPLGPENDPQEDTRNSTNA